MTKTKPIPMLLKQQQSFHVAGKQSDAWELVLRAVTDHHKVHRIGRQDSNFTLAQALLSLYELGADIGKINSTYHIMAADLEPTASIGQGSINAENWRAYIGKIEMYRGFVEFFDRELASRGVEGVFDVYFPSLLDGCLGSHSIAMAHIAFGLENSLPTMISEGMAHICTTYLDTSDILSVQSSSTGMKCDEVLDMIYYDQRFDGRLSLHYVNNVKLLLNSRRDLLRTYMKYMQTTPKNVSDAQSEIQELIQLAILLIQTPANTVTFSQSPPRSPTHSDMTTTFQSSHSFMSGSLLSSAIAVSRIIPYLDSNELLQKILSFQRLSTICTYIIQGRTPIQFSYAEPTKSLDQCKYAILKSGDIQAGITLCDLDYAKNSKIIDSACFLSMVNLLSDGEQTQRPFPKKSYSWS